jgi:flagellar basal-body rod protein FlgG
MQTPGFKKSRVNFAEMTGVQQPSDTLEAAPQFNGDGTRVLSTLPVFSEGEVRATNVATDMAIDGAGLFELENESGERFYTRAGQFRVDAEGFLAAVNGMRLAQGVQIPGDARELRIAATGEVTALLGEDTERTQIADLELATFAAADSLSAIGQNIYVATESSGAPSLGKPGDAGFGRLQQGYLEMANVDMVEEMSSLVIAQRAYQLNARVLQAADQVLETINNLRR